MAPANGRRNGLAARRIGINRGSTARRNRPCCGHPSTTSWISSGFSSAANHSERAAARRLPRASRGSLSVSTRPITSSRAAAWERLGFVPKVGSSRLSSAVSPRGKQLPIDHAFCKPLGARETQPRCQLGQSLPHEALVARAKNREPIAHHDPVHYRR